MPSGAFYQVVFHTFSRYVLLPSPVASLTRAQQARVLGAAAARARGRHRDGPGTQVVRARAAPRCPAGRCGSPPALAQRERDVLPRPAAHPGREVGGAAAQGRVAAPRFVGRAAHYHSAASSPPDICTAEQVQHPRPVVCDCAGVHRCVALTAVAVTAAHPACCHRPRPRLHARHRLRRVPARAQSVRFSHCFARHTHDAHPQLGVAARQQSPSHVGGCCPAQRGGVDRATRAGVPVHRAQGAPAVAQGVLLAGCLLGWARGGARVCMRACAFMSSTAFCPWGEVRLCECAGFAVRSNGTASRFRRVHAHLACWQRAAQSCRAACVAVLRAGVAAGRGCGASARAQLARTPCIHMYRHPQVSHECSSNRCSTSAYAAATR